MNWQPPTCPRGRSTGHQATSCAHAWMCGCPAPGKGAQGSFPRGHPSSRLLSVALTQSGLLYTEWSCAKAATSLFGRAALWLRFGLHCVGVSQSNVFNMSIWRKMSPLCVPYRARDHSSQTAWEPQLSGTCLVARCAASCPFRSKSLLAIQSGGTGHGS